MNLVTVMLSLVASQDFGRHLTAIDCSNTVEIYGSTNPALADILLAIGDSNFLGLNIWVANTHAPSVFAHNNASSESACPMTNCKLRNAFANTHMTCSYFTCYESTAPYECIIVKTDSAVGSSYYLECESGSSGATVRSADFQIDVSVAGPTAPTDCTNLATVFTNTQPNLADVSRTVGESNGVANVYSESTHSTSVFVYQSSTTSSDCPLTNCNVMITSSGAVSSQQSLSGGVLQVDTSSAYDIAYYLQCESGSSGTTIRTHDFQITIITAPVDCTQTTEIFGSTQPSLADVSMQQNQNSGTANIYVVTSHTTSAWSHNNATSQTECPLSSCVVGRTSDDVVTSFASISGSGQLQVDTTNPFTGSYYIRCNSGSSASTVRTADFTITVVAPDCTSAASYQANDLSAQTYYTQSPSLNQFSTPGGTWVGGRISLSHLFSPIPIACSSLQSSDFSACSLYQHDGTACTSTQSTTKHDSISFYGSYDLDITWKLGDPGSADLCQKCTLQASGEVLSSSKFTIVIPKDCSAAGIFGLYSGSGASYQFPQGSGVDDGTGTFYYHYGPKLIVGTDFYLFTGDSDCSSSYPTNCQAYWADAPTGTETNPNPYFTVSTSGSQMTHSYVTNNVYSPQNFAVYCAWTDYLGNSVTLLSNTWTSEVQLNCDWTVNYAVVTPAPIIRIPQYYQLIQSYDSILGGLNWEKYAKDSFFTTTQASCNVTSCTVMAYDSVSDSCTSSALQTMGAATDFRHKYESHLGEVFQIMLRTNNTISTTYACLECLTPGGTSTFTTSKIEIEVTANDCTLKVTENWGQLTDYLKVDYAADYPSPSWTSVQDLDSVVPTYSNQTECPVVWTLIDNDDSTEVSMNGSFSINGEEAVFLTNAGQVSYNWLGSTGCEIQVRNATEFNKNFTLRVTARNYIVERQIQIVSSCQAQAVTLDSSFNPTSMAYINVLSSEPLTFSVPKVSRTGMLCPIANYTVPSLPEALSFDEGTGSDVVFTVNSGYETSVASYTTTMRITTSDGLVTDVDLTLIVKENCALSPVSQATPTVESFNVSVQEQGSITVAELFTSADSVNCQIQDYRIYQVLDQNGTVVTSHGFVVSSTGEVSFSMSSFAYEEYQVQVQASNGQIWGPETPATVMIVTQYQIQEVETSSASDSDTSSSTSSSSSSSSTASSSTPAAMQPVTFEFRQQVMSEIKEQMPIPEPKEDKFLVPRIDSVDQIGRVRIMFSEQIKQIDSFRSFNKSLLSVQGFIFQVDYRSNLEEDDQNRPILQGFSVQNMTDFDFVIKLNFSKPLYVSSGDLKDTISIQFVNPFLFQAAADQTVQMKENTKLTTKIGSQMVSETAFASAQSMASSAGGTLDATVAIPLVIQLFGAIKLDLIWSALSIMQIIVNFKELERIKTPAIVDLLLEQLDKTVNFKLTEQPMVADQIKKYTPVFKEFIDSQGVLVIGAVVFTVVIGVVVLLKLVCKNEMVRDAIRSVQRKLMWSAVFRSLIQGYLIATLMTFNQLKVLDFTQGPGQTEARQLSAEEQADSEHQNGTVFQNVVTLLKLVLFIGFPIFAVSYLQLRRGRLRKARFQAKFGTLYSSVRIHLLDGSMWPLWNVSIFLFVRLVLAWLTVYLAWFPWCQMFIQTFLVLGTCCYIIEGRPMESPFLNRLELVNQCFLLSCVYFLYLFTDFVSVELRQEIGRDFFNYVLVFSGCNIMTCVTLIIWDVVRLCRLKRIKADKLRVYNQRIQDIAVLKEERKVERAKTLKEEIKEEVDAELHKMEKNQRQIEQLRDKVERDVLKRMTSSKKDGNQEIELKIKDSKGRVVKHQFKHIKMTPRPEDYGDGEQALRIDKHGRKTYQLSGNTDSFKSPNNILRQQVEMQDKGYSNLAYQFHNEKAFKRLADNVKMSDLERLKLKNNQFTMFNVKQQELMNTGPTKYPQNLSQLIYWKLKGPLKFYEAVDKENRLGLRPGVSKSSESLKSEDEAKSEIDSDEVTIEK